MTKLISLCCSLALVIGLTACSQEKAPEPTTKQAVQQTPGPGTAAPQSAPVSGKILETMDAAGYTYLNVQTASGDKWVAVNQTKVEVGEEVAFMDGMVMQNFVSKTLDRTFPEIVFSPGLVGKAGAPPAMPPAGAPPAMPPAGAPPAMPPAGAGGSGNASFSKTFSSPPGDAAGGAPASFSQALSSEGTTGAPAASNTSGGSQKAVVPFAEIKIEKVPGENSYTVEEIFTKAAELNGQTVVVKGKIMKVSPRIMGRNWIHIQDGTGNPAANTHDLVITTDMEPTADMEIITMEGKLTANKDFGAGYSYKVIIEEAQLKQ